MFSGVQRIANLVTAILALAGIAFLAWFVYTTFFQDDAYKINTSGTAVVKEIQKLQRLETASYTVEKIIDAGTAGNRFEQFLFGDRILLIANGQIVAGFDFAQVKESDLLINGPSINLNLPAPQILFTRLDNDKTRVYDRSTGLLTKGERDLEAEARAAAEISLRQAACEAGLLVSAEQNGRKQMTAFLTILGFTSVTVNIPKATCS